MKLIKITTILLLLLIIPNVHAQSTEEHYDIIRSLNDRDAKNYLIELKQNNPIPRITLDVLNKNNANLLEKKGVREFLREEILTEPRGFLSNNAETRLRANYLNDLRNYPEIINKYFQQEYQGKIEFQPNSRNNIARINKYDPENKFIQTGAGANSNEIYFKDINKKIIIQQNNIIRHELFDLLQGAKIKTEERTLYLKRGRITIHNLKEFKEEFDELIILESALSANIEGITYSMSRTVNYREEIEIEILNNTHYKISIPSRGDNRFTRSHYTNIDGTRQEILLTIKNAELIQNTQEPNKFKTTRKGAELIINTRDRLSPKKDATFYIYQDDVIFENILNGFYVDPCALNNDNFCIAWNSKQNYLITRTNHVDPIESTNIPRHENPLILDYIDLEITRMTEEEYIKGIPRNYLNMDLKLMIEKEFEDVMSEIFDPHLLSVNLMYLKKALHEFENNDQILSKQTINELKQELEHNFPNIGFDFVLDESRIPLEQGGLILNNPIHPPTIDFFKDGLVEQEIIEKYEHIFRIIEVTSSDRTTGYIDNEGGVWLPHSSEISANIDFVDEYLKDITDIQFDYGLRGTVRLSTVFQEETAALLMQNTINDYIRRYNAIRNEENPVITQDEAQTLVDVIRGNARIGNGREIYDIQQVLNKLPLFAEGLGRAGTDNKLGPLTSKTLIAFSHALKNLLPAETSVDKVIVYYNKLLFKNGLHFIHDISGSVQADLVVQQKLLEPISAISQGTNFFSYTPYIDHSEQGVGETITDSNKLKDLTETWRQNIPSQSMRECPIYATHKVLDRLEQEALQLNKDLKDAIIITTLHVDSSLSQISYRDDIEERNIRGYENLRNRTRDLGINVYFFITDSGFDSDAYFVLINNELMNIHKFESHNQWMNYAQRGQLATDFFEEQFYGPNMNIDEEQKRIYMNMIEKLRS